MTTVNNDDLSVAFAGFAPQSSFLLANPSTRPIFTSIIIILKVYPVLLLVLGSLGNVLSFCVLLRANMRRYSTFCYLACLALVDIGVIITFCVNFIALYHFNYDIQSTPFPCKLFAFSIYFLPQYSSWILVAVSIDRVISAKYLRLAKTWSKPRHSVLVTLLLGLFLALLNGHFFLYENNSLKPVDSRVNLEVNRTDISQFLPPNAFVHHQSDQVETFHSLLDRGADFSGSSLPYEPYTPASMHRDTTLQHDGSPAIKLEPPPSFDVNMIYCSLESSPQHEKLHFYWIWIDLLMNVFLPFTGKSTEEPSIDLSSNACFFSLSLSLVASHDCLHDHHHPHVGSFIVSRRFNVGASVPSPSKHICDVDHRQSRFHHSNSAHRDLSQRLSVRQRREQSASADYSHAHQDRLHYPDESQSLGEHYYLFRYGERIPDGDGQFLPGGSLLHHRSACQSHGFRLHSRRWHLSVACETLQTQPVQMLPNEDRLEHRRFECFAAHGAERTGRSFIETDESISNESEQM